MLSSRTAGSDRVTFVYVPGGSTQGTFAAFLRDYDALFRRLGQRRIRFCRTSPDVARKARSPCYRRYQTTGLAMHPALTRPGDPVVRPRPLALALVQHLPGVAPSLALSGWWSARFRAAAVSIDLSISLSIDLSIRHHIADSTYLLLHLKRDQGRRLVNEVVRVRGDDREHDRYLTETRCQYAGSRSTAA